MFTFCSVCSCTILRIKMFKTEYIFEVFSKTVYFLTYSKYEESIENVEQIDVEFSSEISVLKSPVPKSALKKMCVSIHVCCPLKLKFYPAAIWNNSMNYSKKKSTFILLTLTLIPIIIINLIQWNNISVKLPAILNIYHFETIQLIQLINKLDLIVFVSIYVHNTRLF